MKSKLQKGFTLIELMVVIAVIAILVSIIMISVAYARNKSKDAIVKQEFREMEKLLILDYGETGSYANFQPNMWMSDSNDCVTGLTTSSNYSAKAIEICNILIKNTNGSFLMGSNGPYGSQRYSIQTTLYELRNIPFPGASVDYCVGYSGIYYGPSFNNNNSTQKGCLNNP